MHLIHINQKQVPCGDINSNKCEGTTSIKHFFIVMYGVHVIPVQD